MRRQAIVTIVASGLMGLMAIGASAQEPPAAADAESHSPMFGCVNSPSDRAMGMYSRTPALVGGEALNAAHPEARLYDAIQDGELRVVRVEFLMPVEE